MPSDKRPPADPKNRESQKRDSLSTGTESVGPRAAKAAAPWIRLTGAGMELALVTIVFGAIGSAIDHQFQWSRPIAAALGGLLGFAFGMFRFIRLATSVSAAQRAAESNESAKSKRQS